MIFTIAPFIVIGPVDPILVIVVELDFTIMDTIDRASNVAPDVILIANQLSIVTFFLALNDKSPSHLTIILFLLLRFTS